MTEPQTPQATPEGKEKRRSIRVVVVVPVEVSWQEPDGSVAKEAAETESVNRHGALLRMKTNPPVSATVEILHSWTAKTAAARVVRHRGPGEDDRQRVAVELAAPSETFWGVTFQLQEITALLRRLEDTLHATETDPRVQRVFDHANRHLRRTSWMAQQWAELEAKGHDPYALLTQLTTERIQHVTDLSRELSTDLDASEVTFETEGLEKLFSATQGLYNRLARLFRK